MIKALALIAAVLTSGPTENVERPEAPPRLERCVTSCNWATGVCFFEMQAECGRSQVCVDVPGVVECRPLRVILGYWNF